jgi:Flp pilus assembly pilin Flp
MSTFERLLLDDAGQGLVEYALIIALVSIVALAGLSLFGGDSNNSLNKAANSLQ